MLMFLIKQNVNYKFHVSLGNTNPTNSTLVQDSMVKMYAIFQLDWLQKALGLFCLYQPSRRSF